MASARTSRQAERFVDVVLPMPLRRSFSYRLPEGMAPPAPGSRVLVPFGAASETGFVIGSIAESQLDPVLIRHPERVKELQSLLDDEPWLDASLLRIARWMEAYYGASLGETLRAMLPIKPLKRPRQRVGASSPPAPAPAPLALSGPQEESLAAIGAGLDARRFAAFLLYGVTGSGKTEVYLRAIARVIDSGRQAIVLVPEISLTPQMARRFRERLGEKVGIFHSGLSAGERYSVWRDAREGRISVVLGPRSAVFAPLPRLGLIVVDEEHDASYKQTEKPRYHARSVALMRARDRGAAVILGSATPSLESFHNARQGKYHLLRLPERVGGGRLPGIEVVDMTQEGGALLSPALAGALEDCAGRGDKAMLLLNRRGHSRLRLCRNCGHVERCPRCEISLTYHSGRERLLCHYCGLTRGLDPRCPACDSAQWTLLGAGTQQLEMELAMRFPELPLMRMDLDSTRRRGAHEDILTRFGAPGPALLLGTQMIAKGHHFPEVTVAGVVAADLGLFLPDFRAAERSWQLLEQISGRAGRGRRSGRVLIQTYNPGHPVLTALRERRLESFMEAELAERSLLGYPPARRLVSLLISGAEDELVQDAARRLKEGFRERWSEHPADCLGPVQAFLPRLKGRSRWQLLFKGRLGPDQKRWFSEYFYEIAKSLHRSGAMSLDLDVDPESIL